MIDRVLNPILLLLDLLPSIVKPPYDKLTLRDRAKLFRLALQIIIEQVQSRCFLHRLDYNQLTLLSLHYRIIGVQ